MKTKQMNDNKDNWLVVGIFAIVLTLFVAMSLSEYLSYLTVKHKYVIIETALAKDWSADQIQGMLNSQK